MKFNKEALEARLKEKTTWVGIGGAVAVAIGLGPEQGETIAAIFAILAAALWPESD